jgi:hypothetical protein
MIVEVWTLKRGPLTPPEPLETEHSEWVERLWWEQDNPVVSKRIDYWGTMRRELPTASGGR